MQRWLIRGNRLLSPSARPANLLALVKAEFRQSLDGLRCEVADPLAQQIERARSLRELWHLRSALFGRLAIDFSQSEAERRLAGLNRHFPTRSPRPFGAWAVH